MRRFAIAASAQAPGSRNPAVISGGTYTADPDHTLVLWTLDHLGFTPYTGMFGSVTASTGLTQHLLRPGKEGGKPDFFGPTPADARFVSTKLVISGQTAKLTGDFTFNGVTRPVTLDVTFYGAGRTHPICAARKTSASAPQARSGAANSAWPLACRSSVTR